MQAAGRLTSVLAQFANPDQAPEAIQGAGAFLVRDELNGMLLEGTISEEEYMQQLGKLGESGGVGDVAQWIEDKKGRDRRRRERAGLLRPAGLLERMHRVEPASHRAQYVHGWTSSMTR